MEGNLIEMLDTMAKDSTSTFIEYLANRVESVRFFSYGSNMNRKKYKEDMWKAAKKLKLNLLGEDKKKLDLENPEKRILLNFKRELSNESQFHGLAFSICCSLGSKVEGICHDVSVSVLPAFLRKEGLLPSNGKPSYKLFKVCVLGEDQEVLTLLGLKPQPIKYLKQKGKIRDALEYVDASIKGAEKFDVEHSDMIEVKKLLKSLET